jgi:hypothetical protein
MQLGKTVLLYIFVAATTSSTPQTLYFTLPVAPVTTTDNIITAAITCFANGVPVNGLAYYVNSGNKMGCERQAATPWAATPNNGFVAFMMYEVA